MKPSFARQLGFDARASWQARALVGADDALYPIVLSVIAHNFDDQLLPLLQLAFPGFSTISAPFLCTAGRISREGRVYATVDYGNGHREINVLFETETDLQNAFRWLADSLKLSDRERVELFAAVKRWIVCDYRIDPNTGMKEERAA